MPDPTSTIANIVQGATDGAGVEIERVYARISGAYAIYRTAQGVIVQFADDPTLGGQQRQALAPLNPLRSDINGLIDGWRGSADPIRRSRGLRFDARVAAALGMALQGDLPSAQAALTAVKEDIIDLRTSVARTRYVVVAGATTTLLVAVFAGMLTSLFARFPDYDRSTDPFWSAAAIGAIGAWFSIALAIRGRTIQTDLQTRDNDIDAILRVMIGAISASVLLALLQVGVVTFAIGSRPVTEGSGLVVIAFAAGFSERLVSDFLSQQVTGALHAPAAATAAATAAAGATPVKTAPGADELHPLGQPAPAGAAGAPDATNAAAPAAVQPAPIVPDAAPEPAPAPVVAASPQPGPDAQSAAAQGDSAAHADDQADGCGAAGLNVPEAEQTADADLPPTTGGVAAQ